MHKLHDQKDLAMNDDRPEIPPLRYLTAPDGEGRVLITPQTYGRLVELAGEPSLDSLESTRDLAATVAEFALASIGEPPAAPSVGEPEDTDEPEAEPHEVADVVEEQEQEEPPSDASPAEPSDSSAPGLCEAAGCEKNLAEENPNYVQFSKIRFRKEYCEEHYTARVEAQA